VTCSRRQYRRCVTVSGARPSLQATTGVAAIDGTRILLVRRADDGTWCLPGGRVEFGESVRDGARREFVEETGRAVELTGFLGVYSEPVEQTHRYPDGSVVQFVAVVFTGTVGPEVGPLAGDTVEVRWFESSELPSDLMACDAPIIRDALAGPADRPLIA
jgi:ADP-ribose pyrophosphatase YjhB (NUDIX family)